MWTRMGAGMIESPVEMSRAAVPVHGPGVAFTGARRPT